MISTEVAPEQKTPRKRHIPARLKLNDASCNPGPELLDRLVSKRPDPEAIAIQACWRFRFPVKHVEKLSDSNTPIRLASDK